MQGKWATLAPEAKAAYIEAYEFSRDEQGRPCLPSRADGIPGFAKWMQVHKHRKVRHPVVAAALQNQGFTLILDKNGDHNISPQTPMAENKRRSRARDWVPLATKQNFEHDAQGRALMPNSKESLYAKHLHDLRGDNPYVYTTKAEADILTAKGITVYESGVERFKIDRFAPLASSRPRNTTSEPRHPTVGSSAQARFLHDPEYATAAGLRLLADAAALASGAGARDSARPQSITPPPTGPGPRHR